MKVCFLVSNLGFGGAERTAAYLINWGVQNGYDVDVVNTKHGEIVYKLDDKVNLIELDYKKRNKSKNIFKKFHNVVSNYRDISRELGKYVKQHKPDIIFSVLYSESLFTNKFRKQIPIVISERSNPKWLKSRIKKVARKILFKKASAIVFQTKRAKEYYTFLKQKPFKIIPNAVANDIIYQIEYNEKATINKISAVGSLRAQKDYPTLLKAFKIVAELHPDYYLEIFGVGQDEQSLKQQAKDLGIDAQVKFMGNDPEALKKISNAKCYVLSSISEGMPNALMEAMAIGMPCVSTDCENGPAELIEDGKNGLLVPIKSPEKLAEAINKMIENREFALKCGAEAKKLKETNSVDEIAKKYYNFFEDVVKNFKKKKCKE